MQPWEARCCGEESSSGTEAAAAALLLPTRCVLPHGASLQGLPLRWWCGSGARSRWRRPAIRCSLPPCPCRNTLLRTCAPGDESGGGGRGWGRRAAKMRGSGGTRRRGWLVRAAAAAGLREGPGLPTPDNLLALTPPAVDPGVPPAPPGDAVTHAASGLASPSASSLLDPRPVDAAELPSPLASADPPTFPTPLVSSEPSDAHAHGGGAGFLWADSAVMRGVVAAGALVAAEEALEIPPPVPTALPVPDPLPPLTRWGPAAGAAAAVPPPPTPLPLPLTARAFTLAPPQGPP
eukprot:1155522-Pelagomonas_calceolata.AAC.8